MLVRFVEDANHIHLQLVNLVPHWQDARWKWRRDRCYSELVGGAGRITSQPSKGSQSAFPANRKQLVPYTWGQVRAYLKFLSQK